MAEQWYLRGEYAENCNCSISCPCTMDLRLRPSSADGSCHVTLGFDIRQGRYGAESLDGLGAVVVLNSPPGQAMADGNLSAALYLDERASPAQQAALQTILSGQAGGLFGLLAPLLGTFLGATPARIAFGGDAKRRTLRVEGVTEATVEAISGPIDPQQPITLVNMNLFNPGAPLTQAVTVASSYQDHGLQWDNTGRNGYLTALDLKGP
jgi:hypothetical protein